jgi:hypothetical protein
MPKRTPSRSYIETVQKRAEARRKSRCDALKRRIEMGYIEGEVHSDGHFSYKTGRKGFVPYSTRTLVTKIREAMDRHETHDGRRICHINRRHCLQVRGKHLRRVLKAMPNIRQEGRTLVEQPS